MKRRRKDAKHFLSPFPHLLSGLSHTPLSILQNIEHSLRKNDNGCISLFYKISSHTHVQSVSYCGTLC